MGRLPRAFGGAHAAKSVDSILREALLATLDRDLEQTEELLARAVRSDSTGFESYLALGRLFRMRGEIGRAIRIHQNLLLRQDLTQRDRVTALLDLAADFRQGGFLRRAITTYEEVVARQPRNLQALRPLVRLLADVREFPRAIEWAKRLAKLEGAQGVAAEAELYADMAQTARAERRIDDARKAARRALRKDPTLVRAWVALGEIEAERGRPRAALAAFKRVPSLDHRAGPQVYPQIEAALAALGRNGEFEKLLREIRDRHPEDTGASLALARLLAGRGDVEAALAELRGRIELDPDDLAVHAALGRVLLAEGRDAEAAQELSAVLDVLDRRGPTQPRGGLE